jgi:hypothetical protein
MSRTLYDKLVDAPKVCDLPDGDMLICVDFHIMNEYTSPQAFSGLESRGLTVWNPRAHLLVGGSRQCNAQPPGAGCRIAIADRQSGIELPHPWYRIVRAWLNEAAITLLLNPAS